MFVDIFYVCFLKFCVKVGYRVEGKLPVVGCCVKGLMAFDLVLKGRRFSTPQRSKPRSLRRYILWQAQLRKRWEIEPTSTPLIPTLVFCAGRFEFGVGAVGLEFRV